MLCLPWESRITSWPADVVIIGKFEISVLAVLVAWLVISSFLSSKKIFLVKRPNLLSLSKAIFGVSSLTPRALSFTVSFSSFRNSPLTDTRSIEFVLSWRACAAIWRVSINLSIIFFLFVWLTCSASPTPSPSESGSLGFVPYLLVSSSSLRPSPSESTILKSVFRLSRK